MIHFRMMVLRRWIKYRLFKTILSIVCIFYALKIIRGSKVTEVKKEEKIRNDNVRLEGRQIWGSKEMVPKTSFAEDALSKKTKNLESLPLKLDKSMHAVAGTSRITAWREEQSQNQLPKAYNKSFYENRIIHFDLKGAPPKISYFKEVLKLIKANGATGILLEWEDTFPFDGILAENRNSEAYTKQEAHDILDTAYSLGLDVIPLVQTFGHLEWILKLEKFRKHRENDFFPQVICLADDVGVAVVMESLRQVIQFHKPFGIPYFHIGGDEAFMFGECIKDRQKMEQKNLKDRNHLAAMHLAKIANYVKKLIPHAKVLAWHDMVQSFQKTLVREYNLDYLLEIVVWDYSETMEQQNEDTWRLFAEKFSVVWGASAYKGANGISSQFLDVKHYILNNKAWISHRKAYGELFRKFRGLIITGWQRYDHFAVLCELLPVGLPSAILNLLVAKAGDQFYINLLNDAAIALKCSSEISIEHVNSFNSCEFPGVDLFRAIHSAWNRIEIIEKNIFGHNVAKGYLNRFNLHYNYTQVWQLVGFENDVKQNLQGMLETTKSIENLMEPIFRKNLIDEWIYEYLDPTTERLLEILKQINRLKAHKTFPARNFKIDRKIPSEL